MREPLCRDDFNHLEPPGEGGGGRGKVGTACRGETLKQEVASFDLLAQ